MFPKLPLYQCHKQVRAAQIQAIVREGIEPEGSVKLVLHAPDEEGEDYASVIVDADWLARNPAVAEGGYFIVYKMQPGESKNYTAYSPAEPFEDGYTIVDENAPVKEEPEEEKSGAKPYIAIAPGHVGGRVVEVGTVFNYEGKPGKWMKPHGWGEEAPIAKAATPALAVDRKAIMAQLDAAGVSYFKGAPLEKLQALLPKG